MVRKKRCQKKVSFVAKKRKRRREDYISFEVLINKLKHSHLKQQVLEIQKHSRKKKNGDDKVEDKEGYILLKELIKQLKRNTENKKRK